jgi:hypothetical protein
MLQSAARQEGGASSSKRRNTRLLKYALGSEITYEAEYVVPLPTFTNADGKTRVAAQSEVHYISDTQLLVLPRDSSVGRGQKDPQSLYRHVDIVDVSRATNIKGPKFDDLQNGNITAGGISDPCQSFSLSPSTEPELTCASCSLAADKLVAGITAAELCPFIDYNINSELNKFKTAEGDVVHNGAPVNLGLLNEKWEALALVPVNADGKGCSSKDEYYLITLSDNDFITNNGTSSAHLSSPTGTRNAHLEIFRR